MKFVKLIFSRIVIITLSILLQISLIIYIAYKINTDIYIVHIVFGILSVLLSVFIVNKDESATFKLPWIIIMLIVPFAGFVTYLLFGNVQMSKKTFRKMNEAHEEAKELLKSNQIINEDLKTDNIEAYGQSQYLLNTSMLPLYKDTYSHYLPTGEKFYEVLLEELKKAKKYVFMEYFIIEDGKMWQSILKILKEKIEVGVKVYLMYDDIGSIAKVSHNFYKKLREIGIYAVKYNPFKPIVSVAHNNRDHRKLTVIDGNVGFVGGANIADEYINEISLYGYWKDSALIFKGSAVNNLVITFVQLYNVCNYKHLKIDDFINHEKIEDNSTKAYIQPFADGPIPYYKNYIGEGAYLNIINQAKKYVYITTPYLIIDYHFLEALKNAAKRGVDVRIITPHIPDKKIINLMTKNNYYPLICAGVRIFEYEPGFIHSKVFLSDDEIGIVGTINLDYRSLVHHYENAVWLYKSNSLVEIKDDFNKMFNKETIEIFKKQGKLKWYQRIIRNLIALFAPLL